MEEPTVDDPIVITQPLVCQEWSDGELISSETVLVDVTTEVITYDVHVRLRDFLAITRPTPGETADALKVLVKYVLDPPQG